MRGRTYRSRELPLRIEVKCRWSAEAYPKSRAWKTGIPVRWVRRGVPGRSDYGCVAIATIENLLSGTISFRIVIRFGCRAQICDNRSHDVRRGGLRSRVAICLDADGNQTEGGNQTKSGDTKGESHLDKRKSLDPSQAEYHFL